MAPFFFRKFRAGNSSQEFSEDIKSCWLQPQNKNKGQAKFIFEL